MRRHRQAPEHPPLPGPTRLQYALYGLARGDARSLGFESRDGRIISAQLSRVWTIARWSRSELRAYVGCKARRQAARLPRRIGVRLYLAVAPPGAGTLQPRLTLRDGRLLNGRW